MDLVIFCNVSKNHSHFTLKVPLHNLDSNFSKKPNFHQMIAVQNNHLWCCQKRFSLTDLTYHEYNFLPFSKWHFYVAFSHVLRLGECDHLTFVQ